MKIIQHPSRKKVLELNKALRKHREIVLDIETTSLFPEPKVDHVVSVGFYVNKEAYCIILEHNESKIKGNFKLQSELFFKCIQGVDWSKKCVIAHNGKFDSMYLKIIFGVDIPIKFDTMIAAYILDENQRRYSLKLLTKNVLGKEDYEIPLDEKRGYGPLDRHCEYLVKDLKYCYRLKKIYFKELRKEKPLYKLFNHLAMGMSELYRDMKIEGFYIDKKQLKKATAFYEKKLNRLDKQLIKYNTNLNSPQQVGQLLFNELGLEPLEMTPKGKPAVSESVLKRLDHRVARKIIDWRKTYKLLNTYLYPWDDNLMYGCIHPNFKETGTVTGRPSCSDPNLQATPREPMIRSCISAPRGFTLVAIDLAQVEMRIAAELSRDPTLMRFFEEGIDPHNYIVDVCFGIKEPTKEQRKKGKAINFGYLYGMWWKNFIVYARDKFDVKVTVAEAKKSREDYFNTYHGLVAWHNRQRNFAKEHGYVYSLVGRKRRLPYASMVTNGYNFKVEEALRQAINSPVQSLASDWNISAGIEINRKLKGHHLYPCGTIHDELLFCIRNKKLKNYLPKIKRIVENPQIMRKLIIRPLEVKIECEIKLGPWGAGTLWVPKVEKEVAKSSNHIIM